MLAHTEARTKRACRISIDPLCDHVLTCQKHTGSIRGHTHLMAPPALASLPFPSPLVPSLSAILASLHSLHLRQVVQCAVPCPFLADIARHYVSLYRSLVSLPPPSLLFPSGCEVLPRAH